MMKLGVFAKTFTRPSVEDTFEAVKDLGLEAIHFNFTCAGLSSLPDAIPDSLPVRIGKAARERQLEISGVSATFNMIHPDPAQRAKGLAALDRIGAACQEMRTRLVTVCTGTRDPDNMWRSHPENHRPDAWQDLLATLGKALASAERHGLLLGIEPEVTNVIATARQARQLLDDIRSPRLRIVLDPANLVEPGQARSLSDLLDEAFDLLGNDLAMAHAKEIGKTGHDVGGALGQGLMDWEGYLSRLRQSRFNGPLIMHGFEESDAAASTRHLRSILSSLS